MITCVKAFATKADADLAGLTPSGIWYGEAPEGTPLPLLEWEHEGESREDETSDNTWLDVATFIVRAYGTAAIVDDLSRAIRGVLDPPPNASYPAGFVFDGADGIVRFDRPAGEQTTKYQCLRSRDELGQLQFMVEHRYQMRVSRTRT